MQIPILKSYQVYAPVSTSGSMLPTRVVERATLKSYTRCKLSQNPGIVPRARPMRSAGVSNDQPTSILDVAHRRHPHLIRAQRGISPHHSPSSQITAITVQKTIMPPRSLNPTAANWDPSGHASSPLGSSPPSRLGRSPYQGWRRATKRLRCILARWLPLHPTPA